MGLREQLAHYRHTFDALTAASWIVRVVVDRAQNVTACVSGAR